MSARRPFARLIEALFRSDRRPCRRARLNVEQLDARIVPVLFGAQVDFPSTLSSTDHVAVGDLNGDNKPDIVVGSATSSTVNVLLGVGNGTFSTATSFPTSGTYVDAIEIADFNRDGKPDLAVLNGSYYDYVSILLGDGAGSFSASTLYYLGYTNATALAVADFNGDGKLDLAAANQSGSVVSVVLGDGNGGFASPVSYSTGTVVRSESVRAGDFDGDGDIDLAVAGGDADVVPSSVAVLLNNGAGVFGAPTIFTVGPAPLIPPLAVADFNGDGKLDLAVGNRVGSDGTVAVLLGTGTGSFAAPVNFPTGGDDVYALAVCDFNNDGRDDLAAANGNDGSSTVAILLGTGTGSFAAPAVFDFRNGGENLAEGDVNGDGRDDLIFPTGDPDGAGLSPVGVSLNLVPAITPVTLPGSRVGLTYSQTLSVAGASPSYPFTFTVAGGTLPVGLTLNAASGAITGTPTVAGTYTFTIGANDGAGDTPSRAYSVVIRPLPSIQPAALPDWTVNRPYSQRLVVADPDPESLLTFGVGSGTLPVGLSLNTTSGAITGTPTVVGTFAFTINALRYTQYYTDGGNDGAGGVIGLYEVVASRDYSVTINPPLGFSGLADATAGGTYLRTLTVTGGTAAYTGLTISGLNPGSTGLTAGAFAIDAANRAVTVAFTPTLVGVATFTAAVTDASGATYSQNYSLFVGQTPSVSAADGPGGLVVLTVDSLGVLTRYTRAGAQRLGGGVAFASVAYGRLVGEVNLVTTTGGALYRFDAAGSRLLIGATVRAASLAVRRNEEYLLVTTTSGSLLQIDAAGVHTIATEGIRTATLSFDANGQPVYLVSFTDGRLIQLGPAFSGEVAGGGVNSAVYVPASSGPLFLFSLDNGDLLQVDKSGRRRIGTLA